MVVKLFPYRAIKTKEPTNNHTIKVNVHRMKEFLEMPIEEGMECLLLNKRSKDLVGNISSLDICA